MSVLECSSWPCKCHVHRSCLQLSPNVLSVLLHSSPLSLKLVPSWCPCHIFQVGVYFGQDTVLAWLGCLRGLVLDQALLWHHPFEALCLACDVDVWLWVFQDDLLTVLPSSDVFDASFGLMDDYQMYHLAPVSGALG